MYGDYIGIMVGIHSHFPLSTSKSWVFSREVNLANQNEDQNLKPYELWLRDYQKDPLPHALLRTR